MTTAGPTAGIEVTTSYSPWAFGLAIIKPKLQLDGYDPVQGPWGTGVLPVPPGRHQLKCWFTWGLFSHGGQASIEVDVPEGALVRLRYRAPTWFVFLKGKWRQDETVAFSPSPFAPAAPALGPGWHPDPSGRHGLRYWDGSAWTPNVSDGGVASTDVPG
jgi:hypothetical protein